MVYILQRKDQTSIVCQPVISKQLPHNVKVKLFQVMIAVGAIATGILVIVHT